MAKKRNKLDFGSTSRAKSVAELEVDDEVVVPPEANAASATPVADSAPDVEPVGAFEGGLTNVAFRGAVSARWRRSEEVDLFVKMLHNIARDGTIFFGSIHARSSFLKRSGGSALL